MGLKRTWGEAAFVFVLVTVLLTAAIHWMEQAITEECVTVLHAWIEVVGGTLPETNQIDRTTVGFAMAMTVKLYLVLLPIGGVLGIFYRLMTTERRQMMRWVDLLETRDGAIKSAILTDLHNNPNVNAEQLRETSNMLDRLFQEGQETWERDWLPRIFNEETCALLRQELQNRQIDGH